MDPGHSWLQHLKTCEYDDLSFEERVNVLRTLTHLALDGPAVRAALDGRIEEAQRIRKQMYEDAKVSSHPCWCCELRLSNSTCFQTAEQAGCLLLYTIWLSCHMCCLCTFDGT